VSHFFDTEAEMAKLVLEWLSQGGWDVYPEVSDGGGTSRADLVAVRGPLLWVVECKLSLGLSVVAQADRWQGKAHFVSVATPPAKATDSRRFLETVMAERGIGWIAAYPLEGRQSIWDRWRVQHAAFNRRASTGHLRGLLSIGHKAYSAGAQRGFYTPFRATCDALIEVVSKHPDGIAVKAAIDAIDHHYASDKSARQSLIGWVKAGKLKGIKVHREGRRVMFKPERKR